MAGAYIVANIPDAVLKQALKHTAKGRAYMIDLHVAVCPEGYTCDDDGELIPVQDHDYEIPVAEIKRLTSCRQITADDIINADKRRK